MRQPKIWFVGSGRLSLRIPIMKVLREHGFCCAAVGPEECSEFDGTGFEYFQYPLTRSVNPLSDRRALHSLTRLFAEHRPDIVHAVNTKPSILVPMAASRAGVTAVRTITGLGAVYSSTTPLTWMMRPFFRWAFRKTSKLSARTIFQNPDDQQFFLENHLEIPSQTELIRSSGIDVEEYRNRAANAESLQQLRRKLDLEDKIVVTMITRLIKPKGVEEYLSAAATVRQQCPHVRFLLIGNAVTQGPLAIPVSRVEKHPDVSYLGPRSDIPDLLSISDVFALPSYFREGIPRVLLEAGAMKLPLVTTDSPGCREVVRHEYNGLLIEPRNADSLSAAILRMVRSKNDRSTMGQRSHEFVSEHFHLNTVAAAYEKIYRQVLEQTEWGNATRNRAA